ncbi:MAG: serine hydrolase [bacterium]
MKTRWNLLALTVLSVSFSHSGQALDCKGIVPAASDDPADIVQQPNNQPPSAWVFSPVSERNLEQAVQALPQIVEQHMARTGVPGIAVAVVRRDEVLMSQGFGVREVGHPERITPDTVFQLASVSKPVGATVISAAVSQGLVDWEDRVVDYLPDFKLADDWVTAHVTIADLYSHRSGLPDHAGDDLEDLGFDRETTMQRLERLPLGPFRAQYAYTNFGLTSGGEAVAAAAGTNWESLSEDLLYGPAGMTSTSSRYSDYLAAPNRATAHQKIDGVWVPGPPRDPDPQSPAGGVSSSINDLARWMQLHLGDGKLDGEELIKPAAIQHMRQPHKLNRGPGVASHRASFYGYGLGVSVDGLGYVRFSHSGAFLLGASTIIMIVPGADIAIAVLTNGAPHGIPDAIANAFIDMVETGRVQRDWLTGFEAIYGAFYVNHSVLADQDPPVNPVSAAPLQDYAGTYQNDYFGPLTISVMAGRLEMSLGPGPMRFPLTHWDGDVFSYFPTGENAVGISEVRFDLEQNTVRVEHLDEYGLGTFSR